MKKRSFFKGLDKSLRKQKILDITAELFQKKGYRSTTLEDVAKGLGLTKAALYHYVSSKEDLLANIYSQALENWFGKIYEISALDRLPDEKLRLILRDHIKNITAKNIARYSVFFSEENQLPAKYRQKIRQEKKRYTERIEAILSEGMTQGLFMETDPKLRAYAVLGMLNWIHKWYRPDQSSYTSGQIADHFIALLERGYLEKPSAEERTAPLESKRPARGSRPKISAQDLLALKHQCLAVIRLIEEAEKF